MYLTEYFREDEDHDPDIDLKLKEMMMTQNEKESLHAQGEDIYLDADGLYIIFQGQVNVISDGEVIYTLRVQDSFGEGAFTQMPSADFFGDLHAVGDVICYYIPTWKLLQIVPLVELQAVKSAFGASPAHNLSMIFKIDY